jgi:hypothetical protein
LDFSATDPDNDSLVYTMCAGFNGGSATDASPIDPTPYGDLIYQSGFSGRKNGLEHVRHDTVKLWHGY